MKTHNMKTHRLPEGSSIRRVLFACFLAASDSSYADFQSRLIPDAPKGYIIGVRMPKLRAIARASSLKNMSRPFPLSDFLSDESFSMDGSFSVDGPFSANGPFSASSSFSADGPFLHWKEYFVEIEAACAQKEHCHAASKARLVTPPCYEEIMTAGLSMSYAELSLEERFFWISRFVPMMDSWAVCDGFCSTWKPKKAELAPLWDFLKSRYLPPCFDVQKEDPLQQASEYGLRYGLVMLLQYFISYEEYIDEILAICNEISHPAYYVKMAVAWTLSYAFFFFPEKTLAFFQSPDYRLDDFTHNKTIQKVCESLRIPRETKALLRRLRR